MRTRITAIGLLAIACSTGGSRAPSAEPVAAPGSYLDTIPGTLVTFTMIAVPGDPLIYIGKTEVTWDEYDVFAYKLDEPAARGGRDTAAVEDDAEDIDAMSRPSRPYGAPDYGWGHQGYPAISIAAPAALEYADWLSARTGKRYRLATDAEWTRAATAGLAGLSFTPALLDSLAWHAGNSGNRAHPVAAKRADALGLYDVLGNAAEWVTGADGRPLTRGGSWADQPSGLSPLTSARYSPAWQERDPQFPKSRWWLSDGPFVGFRLVREP
jgi:formylglycine-generating enzyme required for sulfatase activity